MFSTIRYLQRFIAGRRGKKTAVVFLLVIQASLLGYSATRHSPTDLEPAFLVSGICHWQFGRFEPYRVNPPLVRMVAALPVIAVGCKTDWSHFNDSPGNRAEFTLGQDFLRVNGADSIPLFFYARWACIPFNLIGSFFAYRWAKELYGDAAGLFTLVLYVFEPNLLAHGELITPDGATTSFGIVAGYTFWRWLKQPSWVRAALAGGGLGLAELCKMSWLILFGLWPVLWLIWHLVGSRTHRNSESNTHAERKTPPYSDGECMVSIASVSAHRPSTPGVLSSLPQLAMILLLGIYLINLGYAFDGFGTPLKKFQFVSKSLTGLDRSGSLGNRFRDTWLGTLPIPLPKQFVLGFDSQKKDLEEYRLPSYLRGELKKQGGWWYYYLYGLLVKVPCGTWGLLVLVVSTRVIRRSSPVPLRDEVVLLAPALVLLVVVSSQTAFNLHLRYVFPALGIGLIFLGSASLEFGRRFRLTGFITSGLLAECVVSLIVVYPHQLAYFNAFVGGPRYGHQQLLGSSLDWGQDLLFLRDHVKSTGQVAAEFRGCYISRDLVRTVIPDFASQSEVGPQIIVVSPNYMLTGESFPPDGLMLTPTLWLIE